MGWPGPKGGSTEANPNRWTFGSLVCGFLGLEKRGRTRKSKPGRGLLEYNFDPSWVMLLGLSKERS